MNQSLQCVLQLAKTQAILARRFDSGLGGLGLQEFIILHTLSCASEQKMRRIDLANAIGFTASGVTRLLLPMEKIGLVRSGEKSADARARYVAIAPGGKMKLHEAMERMEYLMQEIMPKCGMKDMRMISDFIREIGNVANKK